jgi:hypothetical protein
MYCIQRSDLSTTIHHYITTLLYPFLYGIYSIPFLDMRRLRIFLDTPITTGVA